MPSPSSAHSLREVPCFMFSRAILLGVAVTAAVGATSALADAVGSLVLSTDATLVDATRKTVETMGVTVSTEEVEASIDDVLVLLSGRATFVVAVTRRVVTGAASTGRTVRGSVVGTVVVDVSTSAAVSETVVVAALLAELNAVTVLVAATFDDTWKAVAAGFGWPLVASEAVGAAPVPQVWAAA
ncbi:hypothetical protein ACIQUB_12870 [Rhizobium sp. NPDC090275]|uniref:hypothetical protein n=1 Tax=Rhizobium sp. NPDC090275 TaxID=3364498 RepID=UPI00383A9E9C